MSAHIVAGCGPPFPSPPRTPPMHPYTVKIRFNGSISHITVNANSAGQAKQLALAQFGGQVDVLSVTRA